MRIWTDDRDGRTWGLRNNAPRALEMESFELRVPRPDFEERILFHHPPHPPYRFEVSTPNPDRRPVADLDDAELQRLLDEALRKGE